MAPGGHRPGAQPRFALLPATRLVPPDRVQFMALEPWSENSKKVNLRLRTVPSGRGQATTTKPISDCPCQTPNARTGQSKLVGRSCVLILQVSSSITMTHTP